MAKMDRKIHILRRLASHFKGTRLLKENWRVFNKEMGKSGIDESFHYLENDEKARVLEGLADKLEKEDKLILFEETMKASKTLFALSIDQLSYEKRHRILIGIKQFVSEEFVSDSVWNSVRKNQCQRKPTDIFAPLKSEEAFETRKKLGLFCWLKIPNDRLLKKTLFLIHSFISGDETTKEEAHQIFNAFFPETDYSEGFKRTELKEAIELIVSFIDKKGFQNQSRKKQS